MQISGNTLGLTESQELTENYNEMEERHKKNKKEYTSLLFSFCCVP
jgi:hypothetical protein